MKNKKNKVFRVSLLAPLLIIGFLMLLVYFIRKPFISGLSQKRTVLGGDRLEEYMKMSVKDLSLRLHSEPGTITIVSTDEAEFRDSSLGCPIKGSFYTQIISRGYKIILNYQGKDYEYHAASERIVPCNFN